MTIRRALSSLKQVEVITITSEVSVADGDGTEGTLLDTNTNPFLWSGECELHTKALLYSQELREVWVKVKTGKIVEKDDESERHTIPYCHLPSLKRVEWHFYTPEKKTLED